jgi:multimeric flavodoxin WrbA/putative sterol carrier protein
MKVLALNSSARTGGQSKTELMLSHLVEGMREAGADVEIVNLRDKKINVCVGCFTCWTKTPGQCVHQDDMTKELFPKWLAAEVCVYATPLFHHTVNATMKIFIERTLPIDEPFLIEKEDRWIHPLRHKHPAVVVLSVAGFPAMSAFNGLTHYINFLFGEEKGRLLAEIYRPGAEYMIYADKKRDDILEATKTAGNELVKFRKVSPETLARIEQLFSNNLTDFAEMANCMWRTCIAEGITRKKFEKKGMIPRPDSLKTFMLVLAEGFNPEGAKDTRAVLQYDFLGQVEGSCHFIIANGTINAEIGPAEQPDLIIKTPFDIWVDITTGKADGGQMFMEEKYKVEGDMDLFLNMSKFFGQSH